MGCFRRVLGELHRDLSYLMMGRVFRWPGLTVRKPGAEARADWAGTGLTSLKRPAKGIFKRISFDALRCA